LIAQRVPRLQSFHGSATLNAPLGVVRFRSATFAGIGAMNELAKLLDGIGAPRLVVVGDVILDRYAWGNAERVSPEAPVVVLRADDDEIRLGGAASVAYLLRGLGAQVTLAASSRRPARRSSPPKSFAPAAVTPVAARPAARRAKAASAPPTILIARAVAPAAVMGVAAEATEAVAVAVAEEKERFSGSPRKNSPKTRCASPPAKSSIARSMWSPQASANRGATRAASAAAWE
jgi:hypothetical protein